MIRKKIDMSERRNIMKCIYCNSDKKLTSSDIITYAITGAKLTKSFVCETHNAFTNDNYEKKFVSDLDFFINHLGFFTREGNPIQYTADILVDGTEMHNVKVSNREALYAPKSVVSGFDNEGKKVLMAPMEKIEKISKGKNFSVVDMSDVTIRKTISSDSFLGFYAVHSIAKMAYEWYCFVNNIEELKEENNEIVNYILGENKSNIVEFIIDENYYFAIDQISEVGTNTFFQYDEADGYRYVVFDFWKTLAYRIKICKSSNAIPLKQNALFFESDLYRVDGCKSKAVFSIYDTDKNKKHPLCTVQPQNMSVEIWKGFVKRIEMIMSTMVLSINVLKREVDLLSSKLKKYNEEKIDTAQLLGFEENNVVAVIDIINQLYINKNKYDKTKSFNQNLPIILNLSSDTITRTEKEKNDFLEELGKMDKDKTLANYIQKRIDTFYEIFENEIKLTDQNE